MVNDYEAQCYIQTQQSRSVKRNGDIEPRVKNSFNTEYLLEKGQASLSVKGVAAVFWGGSRMGNSIC